MKKILAMVLALAMVLCVAAAAAEFVSYLTSDAAKAIFDSYYFDTNV